MTKFAVKPRLESPKKVIVLGESTRGDRALIGEMAEVGPRAEVFLSMDYEHVVGIFGKRGSGKSHLLGSLLEALAWTDGNPAFSDITVDRGAILFDLLNIFQWMAESPAAPINIRLFHVPGYSSPTALSTELSLQLGDLNAEDWCVLFGIDGIREPMGQILYEAVAEAKAKNVRTIDGLIKVVSSIGSRFSAETVRAVTQRLSSYSALHLFSETGIPLRELCRSKSASIVLFAGVPEDVRSLYIFLIIRRIFEERVKSSQIEKATRLKAHVSAGKTTDAIPHMWLFIDEAQNVIPPRNQTYAVDMLARYVREGRNYGLSLCFTTQQPSSVDGRIMAQIDTLVSFVLTVPSDLNAIVGNLKNSSPDEITLLGKRLSLPEAIRALSVGQCLVSNMDAPRAIIMAARERLTIHGGGEG